MEEKTQLLMETLKEEQKESQSVGLWGMKEDVWKGLKVDLSDLHLV